MVVVQGLQQLGKMVLYQLDAGGVPGRRVLHQALRAGKYLAEQAVDQQQAAGVAAAGVPGMRGRTCLLAHVFAPFRS